MLNLFMQVPRLVRTRLAKRCREVYDYMLQSTRGDGEDDDDNGPQQARAATGTGKSSLAASRRLGCTNTRTDTYSPSMQSTSFCDLFLRPLSALSLQVAPLDLGGVDLSQPSGQHLSHDHKWTLVLIAKLAVPAVFAIVR